MLNTANVVRPVGPIVNNDVTFAVAPNKAHYLVFDNKGLVDVDNFVFKFDVLGASDASLMFSTVRGDRSEHSWEVVLGLKGNTQSEIRVGTQGKAVTTVVSPGIISASKFTSFWITVIDDPHFVPSETEKWRFIMTVGQGSVVGKQVLMSANLPYINSDFLVAGFGAWDEPAVFSNINFPHADLSTAETSDLEEWLGADYVAHAVQQQQYEQEHMTDDQRAALERARAERIQWRNSVNDSPSVTQPVSDDN